jgi:translation initiation factor IF-3
VKKILVDVVNLDGEMIGRLSPERANDLAKRQRAGLRLVEAGQRSGRRLAIPTYQLAPPSAGLVGPDGTPKAAVRPGGQAGAGSGGASSKLAMTLNDQVVEGYVRLVDSGSNASHGLLTREAALARASAEGLDLMRVTGSKVHPGEPGSDGVPDGAPVAVCKILDVGRYLLERRQSTKEQRGQQKTSGKVKASGAVKEVRFSPDTGDHDILTKANQIRRFAAKGHQIRLGVRFKRADDAMRAKGTAFLGRVVAEHLDEDGFFIDESSLRQNGMMVTCALRRRKVVEGEGEEKAKGE